MRALLNKQSAEKFFIEASIYPVADAAEQIDLNASDVTAVDKNGADVSADFLQQNTKVLANDPRGGTNNVLRVKCRDGSPNASPYHVTFSLHTTASNVFEMDTIISVKEE